MAVISGRISSKADSRLDVVDSNCAIPMSSPNTSSIRGACPSLEEPMMTGDGLLVRLRPKNPTLYVEQFRQLAAAAARHGNGLIEVTARGSLQLRGLRDETLAHLAADIAEADIIPETGLVIETPPLSSIDPTEIADARVMAAKLREAIANITPPPVLAPKLSIVIDGGARAGLGQVLADIRLTAVRGEGDDVFWIVAIAGDGRTAQRLAVLPGESALDAVIAILKRLAEIGPRARGRDLDCIALQSGFTGGPMPGFDGRAIDEISPIGVHQLCQATAALGVGLPYAQIRSDMLIPFLDRIEALGVSELRLSPDHGFMLLSVRSDVLEAAKLAAANFGLLTTLDDPRSRVHACAGSSGCASALYETKALATELAGSGLFDGSMDIHLSGCSKGCAHPGRAALALVGTPLGYALVVNGSASDEPAAYIRREKLQSTLFALKQLVDQHKGAGESIDACLKRLGKDQFAKALDRDRNA